MIAHQADERDEAGIDRRLAVRRKEAEQSPERRERRRDEAAVTSEDLHVGVLAPAHEMDEPRSLRFAGIRTMASRASPRTSSFSRAAVLPRFPLGFARSSHVTASRSDAARFAASFSFPFSGITKTRPRMNSLTGPDVVHLTQRRGGRVVPLGNAPERLSFGHDVHDLGGGGV